MKRYSLLSTTLALAALLYLAGCGEDNPPATNTAPVFGQSTYSFTLAENAATGDEIGSVSATDADENATLTYSITTTQTDFGIDESTGSVTVAEAAALDFELTTSYTLAVQVSDGTDTDTADITITITDVNEFVPEFANDSYEFEIVADVKSGDEVGKIAATDSDGTAQLTYTLSDEGAANFAITAGTNVASGEEATVTVAANADLSSLTSPVKLTVMVSDGDNMANAEVEIVITPVGTGTNAAPVFSNTPYTFNVASDAADEAVVGTVSATDLDEGAMLTYSLSGTDAGSFAISNTAVASGEEVSITVATNANLSSLTNPVMLTIEVSDGSNQATANVGITIIAGNVAPVFASTSYNFTVASGASEGDLVGTVSATDSNDGDLLAYSLSGEGADNFAIDNTAVASGTDVSITVAANANLSSLTNPVMLTIEVSDGTDQVTANVGITIIAGNVAPVFASTSYNFTVASGASEGDLVGTVSATDSNDGDMLAYSLRGEGADNFAIDHAAVASDTDVSVTVAANADLSSLGGSVTLTATVTDDATPALMADVAVEITITAGNVAPVFASTDYAFSVASDAAAETPVGTVSATDSNDGDMLIYSLSDEGADNFAISNAAVASGTDVPITVAANADLSSLGGSVTLTVTVADNATPALTATANVEITIIAGNVAPVFDQTAYTFTIAENAANGDEVGKVSATDSNADDLLTYTLSGEGAGNFEITNGTDVASGAEASMTVSSTAALDFETTPSYMLQVQVSDDATPALTVTETVEIAITNVETAPVLTVSGTQTVLNEGTFDAETSTGYTVTATDEDGDEVTFSVSDPRFAIASGDGTLNIVANAEFDFEDAANPSGAVTLTIAATDNSTGTLSSTEMVDITLTDVAEAPVLTVNGTQTVLNEGTFDAETSTGYMVTATDEDGDEVTFSVSDPRFAIASGDGTLNIVANAEFDFEDAANPSGAVTLTITATDNSTEMMTATAAVTINVNNLNDNDPVFGQTAYTFEIEGAKALSGDEVGTVAAMDADAGTTLEYSITNTPTEFDIDANTGIITVSDAAELDRTMTPSYALTVEASDGANMGTATLTINIVGVDYDVDGDGLIDINNLEQLNAMRWDLDGDGMSTNAGYATAFPDAATFATTPTGYELVRSLDFDAAESYGSGALNTAWSTNTGTGWDPIGTFALEAANNAPFVAVFAGNAYTISNLYINRGSESQVGLFGHVGDPGTVRDVGLLNVDITGDDNVGGLVGVINISGTGTITIENSYATGTVMGGCTNVGGLVGISQHSSAGTITIRSCYAECTVMGTGENVGGLVGQNNNSSTGTTLVTACYATGNVTGAGERVGGLVGESRNTDTGTITITACYATGDVTGTGTNNVGGGLVGFVFRFTIRACYARGAVTGTGTANLGGLVGSNVLSTITASYYDSTTTGQSDDTGKGTPQTTDELQMPTGYAGIYADWNVDVDGATGADDPWDFGTADDYPVLKVDFNNDGSTADDVTRQRQ